MNDGIPVSPRSWVDSQWPWLVYMPMYAIPWIWKAPDARELFATAIGGIAFLAAYSAAYRSASARLPMAFAIQLIAILLGPFGGNWSVVAIYAAAVAGTIRPMRSAAGTIALLMGSTSAAGWALGQPFLSWLPGLFFMGVTGFATISREAFLDRTRALLRSQEEVRRLAGTAERERITRDLHDVVGRTLTLVALKADLAAKLVGRDRGAAEAEMQAVAALAREGLSEVRAALAGEGGGTLAHETAASAAALTAAGVAPRLIGDPATVPADAGAVLAMTLREAVTNVIRHADARGCTIDLSLVAGEARLTVADDGRCRGFREGNGLTGMRQRLTAAGGSLAVTAGGGGTRLIASVPA